MIAARRRSSIASSEADTGESPRRASPASNAAGLSRIDLMSCMASPEAKIPTSRHAREGGHPVTRMGRIWNTEGHTGAGRRPIFR